MGRPLEEFQRFFSELKRRNVYRVGIAYAVVAFVVWQAASLLFPALRFPAWTVDFVIVFTLLGFPVALVVAWAFEMTPEGVRRTPEAETPEEVAVKDVGGTAAGYRLLVLVGLVAAAVAGGWYLTGGGGNQPADGEPGSLRIAVLPFESIGADEGDASFARGMREELLNQLGTVSALEIVSGKSGSEAGRAEMTAAEIAREITSALEAEFTEDERRAIAEPPTTDLAAYDAFLRGRDEWGRIWHTLDPIHADSSLEYLRRAVSRDSSFVQAQVWLGRAFRARHELTGEVRWLDSAAVWADRARSLAPDHPSLHVLRGGIYRARDSLEAAEAAYQRAIEGRPDDADPAHSLAVAVDSLRGRADRSPGATVSSRARLAAALAAVGRREEALENLASAVRAGFSEVEWLEAYPLFRNVRPSPRFGELIDSARVNRERLRERVREMGLDLYPPGAGPVRSPAPRG